MVGDPAEPGHPLRGVERRRARSGDAVRPQRGQEGPQQPEMDLPGKYLLLICSVTLKSADTHTHTD